MRSLISKCTNIADKFKLCQKNITLCIFVFKYKVEFYTVNTQKFRERLKLLRKNLWREEGLELALIVRIGVERTGSLKE